MTNVRNYYWPLKWQNASLNSYTAVLKTICKTVCRKHQI